MAKQYVELRHGNAYFIVGTRISLDSVVHAFLRGETPEAIRQNFDLLSLEEVYGAITFYLANRIDIDAYLLRQAEQWRAAKRDSPALPAALRQKLRRARQRIPASA